MEPKKDKVDEPEKKVEESILPKEVQDKIDEQTKLFWEMNAESEARIIKIESLFEQLGVDVRDKSDIQDNQE